MVLIELYIVFMVNCINLIEFKTIDLHNFLIQFVLINFLMTYENQK